jgi:hypothetical protein
MSLVNATPYSAAAVPTYDARGRRVVVVIVKATFELNGRGDLVPRPSPRPFAWRMSRGTQTSPAAASDIRPTFRFESRSGTSSSSVPASPSGRFDGQT